MIDCLITPEQLSERVRELASEISIDYVGKQPLVVGVLKGAWIFMADLVRCLGVPVRCDFVKICSYGNETRPSHAGRMDLDLTLLGEGEDVLVVEDIVDTGASTAWLLEHLRRKSPASLRLCALLDKPARRRVPVRIDYLGFTVPDRFIVGYGIDWAEQYRHLPYVGALPDEETGA